MEAPPPESGKAIVNKATIASLVETVRVDKASIASLTAAAAELTKITQSALIYIVLGSFMVSWSRFEGMLEILIKREAAMSDVHAVIICSGLGFERKASIARSLLALHGEKFKTAIALINKIVTDAERNAIIHGLVDQSQLNCLGFTKRSTDQKLNVKSQLFDAPKMQAKVQTLTGQLDRLGGILGIPHTDVVAYEKMTRSLASSSPTAPNPPS